MGCGAFRGNRFGELEADAELAEAVRLSLLDGPNQPQNQTTEGIAITELKTKLTRSQRSGDRGGELGVLFSLGDAHDDLSHYEKAIEYYSKALAICQEIGHRQGEGACLGNRSIAYEQAGPI